LPAVCAAAQFTSFVSVYNLLTEFAAHAADPSQVNKDLIRYWGYVAAAGIAGYGILTYASLMLSHIAAYHILYETRIKIVRKLARLPLGFFTKRSSGELKKVLSEDVERIELFVAHHIPDITAAIVVPVLLLGYMFWADWRLALVMLTVFAVAIGFQSLTMTSKAGKSVYDRYQVALGKMNGSIVEFIRGIQVVKIFNRSTKAFERLNRNINDYRDVCIHITHMFTPAYLGFYTVLSAILIILIPLSVILLQYAPSYPDYVPTVLLFLILAGGVFFPLVKLLYMSNLMMQNTTGVELIDSILNREEVENPVHPETPRDASVKFRDVTFAYNGEAVLKGISFKALPGTVTALAGPSGAGKSTAAMLTARFWDIQSGEILIGGVPVKNIRTENLMNSVSFVFQDSLLFFDTIEENIRMGNKTATIEDVRNAARAAQCYEFIEKLDKAYQTHVGEGGTYLSGGEQQRIALARTILKDAPIVLLDEATAYADPENEGKILSSFSRLIKGKTVLVIAHRLSTITNADRILLINNGIIEERGTHNELLALQGYYARMWDTYSQAREWTITGKEEQP
ncbi:MAG: ABC transporter ATP-binding protein/permease, partial [Prevotellaceae bacterium]|nr:ABC transporter ATP-binding protein/permease [Prevotellaceae bacterium]